MKKVIATVTLGLATLALVACSTANSSDTRSGNAVFERGVTK